MQEEEEQKPAEGMTPEQAQALHQRAQAAQQAQEQATGKPALRVGEGGLIGLSAPDPLQQKFGLIKTRQDLEEVALYVSQSGIAPKGLDTPQAVYTVMLWGLDIGIAPSVALFNLYNIDGKPTISVHLAGCLLERAGFELEWIKRNEYVYDPQGNAIDMTCVKRFHYHSKLRGKAVHQDYELRWSTCEMAGWTKRKQWQTMGILMHQHRTSVLGARDIAPSAYLGMYEVTELLDSTPAGKSNFDYELDEDGTPVVTAKENNPITS